MVDMKKEFLHCLEKEFKAENAESEIFIKIR